MNRPNSSPVKRPTYARLRARKDMQEKKGRSAVSSKRPTRESSENLIVVVDAKTRRPDLDDQLKALQCDATGHYETYRRSHDQLYQLLARVYLWWRDASREIGYLDSLYEQRGIGHRTDGNRPNFNPLIRLVWGESENIDPTKRVTISQWSIALQVIDEHYSENPQDFDHNPEGKLVAFIQFHGGVSGLLAEAAKLGKDRHRRHRKQGRPNKAGKDVVAKIARHALSQLKASKGIATLITKQPIRVGADNLSVLLGRRDPSGPIAILGSSNDPSQIEAVATTVARRDLTNVCPILRALVEIIGTQIYPWHALPSSHEKRAKWFRTKYAEQGDLYDSDLEGWEGEEPGRRLTSSKRLLLRGENREAIFSGGLVTVSPVTRCILKEPLIEVGDVVFLRTDERAQIEQWYETGELALLRADLERASEADARYKLEVKSAITGLSKILHFYDHSSDKKTHYQAEFRRDAFMPTWHSKLNADWFPNLRQRWADPWFAELGRYNQITRENNEVLEIKITAGKFCLSFNREPDATASEVFEIQGPTRNLWEPQITTYLSKDLAPILFNLADAAVSGAVTIAGNEHALVFTYETSVGQFEIAVPTFDETGKSRDSTLFYAADRKQ